jgi:biopolymer transport protein TolR
MGASQSTNGKSRTTMSEINVTPLVDVMLVLLIIFMVTAPMMQQGLQIDLPETKASGVQATDEPLILEIDKRGRLTLADKKINMRVVGEKVAAIFETRKNKDIYIQADKNVNYGVVAEVMAEVKSSGAKSISLITIPK